MVAYTAGLDFRTNLSASVNLKVLLQEPVRRQVHRINWMNYFSESESGAFLIGDHLYLVEGPLPGDAGQSIGLAQNIQRDDEAFKALTILHPTGSLRTGDMNDADSSNVGHITFPGGIWTVERVFFGFRTAGGVDRAGCTVGYEKVAISTKDWQHLVHHSPNARGKSELIQ